MRFNFFKKEPVDFYTPVSGKIVPLEEVPDPVFSQKMMGDGLAVIPSAGNIVSPVNGTVILVAATKHAVGLRADDGTEILIHVGLETVALDGKGFNVAVKDGDKVSAGQLLIEVDLEYISTNAKSTITPIVITNSEDGKKQYVFTEEKEGTAGKTVLFTASAK
ncbi:PTS glucose transporter subunit IIA [Neobacillus novalis]|uniref:PTS glucose transporter subunit IIA n=1 Tax=Neobacillus novalis TaxID=220687 RepID=A0AA95MMS1_9BACI|nr:PTS glucose transporter subunit IIA [Neobacillus novalis]WHY86884.1 PTS glucose transporter subunit IIA [Neobacillus novalis]